MAAETWTAGDIPDQTGRTIVVTGSNSGLGAVAARELGRAGATVVLACRNTAKAQPVADAIGPNAEVRELDLASLESIRQFADKTQIVDVLINNAGLMAVPNQKTVDGFEMQLGTNHLGHFALTGLLLDRITDRVVTLSSFMHQVPGFSISDLNYENRRYSRWGAYGQSKLANLLFAYELDRRLCKSGSAVKSIAAHPGYASTNLTGRTETFQDTFQKAFTKLVAQSADKGALPELFAATSPDAQGGQFIGPNGFLELGGYPKVVGSNQASRDESKARELWDKSQELTGVTYL